MLMINRCESARILRFVARDATDPKAALLYWLDIPEPSREVSFYDVTQRYSPLTQVVFSDERPGAFVNENAVRTIVRAALTERLVFLDESWLDVWNDRNCADICNLHSCWRHTCHSSKPAIPWM